MSMSFTEMVRSQEAARFLTRNLVYDQNHLCTMPYKQLYYEYKAFVGDEYLMSYTSFAAYCGKWAIQKGVGLDKSRRKNVTMYTFQKPTDSKS